MLVGLGLIIGAAIGSINPPHLSSSATVILPNTKTAPNTFAVMATSDPVLSAARPEIKPAPSTDQALSEQLTASSSSANVVTITAKAGNGATAQSMANAVANSYVGFLASAQSPVGHLNAHVLEPATPASGANPLVHRLVYALYGLLAGLIVGLIAAIARGRGDRRLRSRDDIANSIGVPVLASLPVSRPANAQDWAKLLDGYEPSAVHGWRLRKALQHLNVSGVGLSSEPTAEPPVIGVVTLTKDPRALALGPQLAVYAASLGIPVALAIGPSQDPSLTTALKTACAGWNSASGLRTAVLDESPAMPTDVALTVLVTVVDGSAPEVAAFLPPMEATLIGVTAGVATAEELAATAVNTAGGKHEVAGLLVADPEESDRTTGRVPQLPRPPLRLPTRLTGIKTEVTR